MPLQAANMARKMNKARIPPACNLLPVPIFHVMIEVFFFELCDTTLIPSMHPSIRPLTRVS